MLIEPETAIPSITPLNVPAPVLTAVRCALKVLVSLQLIVSPGTELAYGTTGLAIGVLNGVLGMTGSRCPTAPPPTHTAARCRPASPTACRRA